MLRVPRVEPAKERQFLRELAEGWREFRSRSWLCVTIVQFALINAYAIGAFLVLGPFVAEQHLGGAAAWGFILAAEAAGMIVAGVVALRYRPERPLFVATLAVLTMAPLLALLGLAAPLTLILPAAFVAGVGLELYGVFWDTTLQQHIPDEKLSRVSSYDVLGSFALIPVGVAVMGPISDAIGVADTLMGAALIVVLATIAVISVSDVRNLRRLDVPLADHVRLRPFLLQCVRDGFVQSQLPPLPPRGAEPLLTERRLDGGHCLVVSRLLRRREPDAEALAQRLRGPEQPRRLLGASGECEHRGEPLEAVADHVLELELGEPAQRLPEQLDGPVVLVLGQRGEALVDECERHALAVLERLEQPERLLAELGRPRVLPSLERDPAEVADRERVAAAVARLLVELGRPLRELDRPLLVPLLRRDGAE